MSGDKEGGGEGVIMERGGRAKAAKWDVGGREREGRIGGSFISHAVALYPLTHSTRSPLALRWNMLTLCRFCALGTAAIPPEPTESPTGSDKSHLFSFHDGLPVVFGS